MKTKRVMWSVLGMGCIGLLFAVVAVADDPPEKVELCHVPPGDTSAAHTITVSVKAADSHLTKHEGDVLGACASSCEIADACDDGNMCTSDDCVNGFCVNEVVDCDDGDQCTDNICDPATGCVNADLAAGTPCDDGNPCTTSDQCTLLQVLNGVKFLCLGSNTVALGTPCDDGIECTTDDRCAGNPAANGGVGCTGFVDDCGCFDFLAVNPDSSLWTPFCDADGDVCTQNDRCSGIPELQDICFPDISVSCPCSSDVCDPVDGCPPACDATNCPGVCCGGCCCPDGQCCGPGAHCQPPPCDGPG